MATDYRIFVGGLFPSVNKQELSDRFKSFGEVSCVTIIQRKDEKGEVLKTFGYLNIATTISRLNKCFALFGGTKWNDYPLKVQLAKDNFLTKLQKEWKEQTLKPKAKCKNEMVGTYDEILEVSSSMKRAVPGTVIEGKKNWVVGKYGRPLPIVYIRPSSGRKSMKIDPSKHCHCLKRLKIDDEIANVQELSWSYDKDDIVMRDHLEKKSRPKRSVIEKEIADVKKKKRVKESKEIKMRKEENIIAPKDVRVGVSVIDSIDCQQDFVKSNENYCTEKKMNDIQTTESSAMDYLLLTESEVVRNEAQKWKEVNANAVEVLPSVEGLLSVHHERKTSKIDSNKHDASEKKRLDAVKKNSKSLSKNIVTKALRDEDQRSCNHIKFAGDAVEIKEDLFADDNGDDEDDLDAFRIRRQFEGRHGEELFKLQRKFAGDKRFQLDERFANDESDSEKEVVSVKTHERETNMAVLEKVLGVAVDSQKLINNFNLDRYDPSMEDSIKYVNYDEEIKEAEDVIASPPSTTKEPVVDKDTFFKVDDSLKSLFGGNNQRGFSFLENTENVKEVVNDTVTIEQASWKESIEIHKKVTEPSVEQRDEWRFFLCAGDRRLEKGYSFVRSTSIEEITEQWKTIRSRLHEEYKKKHKDALRRRFKEKRKF